MNKKNKRSFEENWTRWKPDIPNLDLNGNYYIEAIDDNCNFFRVALEQEDTKKKIEIIFPNLILASRHVDESLRSLLFTELSEKYGDEFYAQWAFFKVENSDLLQWLVDDSGGLSKEYKPIHFVIKGVETVLDIIATYDPELKPYEQQII